MSIVLPAPVTIPPRKAGGGGRRPEGEFKLFLRAVAATDGTNAYRYHTPMSVAIDKPWLDEVGVTIVRRSVTETGAEAPKGKSWVYAVKTVPAPSGAE